MRGWNHPAALIKEHTMELLLVAGFVFGYGLFVAVRTGLHRRLPLAMGRISLEAIPDRAARMHGERTLFTSETPCAWEVPCLCERYPEPDRWSAERIRATAGYVAALLVDRFGLQRGDRVAILKENHLDIHVLMAAIVRAGGIACPINGRFAAEKLGTYLENIGARVLISDRATLLRIARDHAGLGSVAVVLVAESRRRSTGPESLEKALATRYAGVEVVWLQEALVDVRHERAATPRGKDEPLYLVHTSGTTGFPKAVILKNGPQSHAVRGWLCYVHLSPARDRGYLAVPNNHQAVMLTFNSLLLVGLRVHWASAYAREAFDAERVVDELARGRFTAFFGFPVTYTQLKEVALERYDLGRMKVWASTADASHAAIVRRFVRVGGAFRTAGLPIPGSVFLDAQGSSEVGTPSVLRYMTRFTRVFDRRVGRPGSTPFGPAIRITGGDGRRSRPGEAGRLEVKGRTVFDGYWNNHAMTIRAIRDRWFFTGDVARLAEDGHIIQLDREVDVIHTRLGPVYSLLIEEAVHHHPAVFDVCVYGARQTDGTQLPAALIALRTGMEISRERLGVELNGMLEGDRRLTRVDIVPWHEFPIGITGKTLKRVLRERTEVGETREANRPLVLAVESRLEEQASLVTL
jgi:acyl-coenzyme A synthetase/AMP-(fatty) acid ligase